MQYLTALKKLTEQQLLYLLTLIASLIAWRIFFVAQGSINDDATLYFEAARLFFIGQWQLGINLFEWPFYSLLIAAISLLTRLNLHHSAELLSVIFFSITCFSLSKIVQLAGGDKVAILAVNLLVWSSLYITGDVLGMLLRDTGFWAFFTGGVAVFMLFERAPSYFYAVLWQLLVLFAMQFRIEAISYLLLIPFTIFLQANIALRFKVRLYLQANTLLIALLLVLTAAITTGGLAKLASLGRMQEVSDIIFNSSKTLLEGFKAKSGMMGEHVLGRYLADYASFSLVISLVCITLYKALLAAGFTPLILLASQGKKALNLPNAQARALLLGTAGIALLNALTITFRSYVLSSRYVVAFGFIVIIFAAFAFSRLYANYKKNLNVDDKPNVLSKKLGHFVLFAAVLLFAAGILKNIAPKPDAYYYEQNAVAWIKNHTQSTSTRIYYDSSRLRYYAQAPWAGREDIEKFDSLITALNNETVRYDYLLMRTKPSNINKQNQLKQLQHYKMIKSFSNKSGNQIIIMQYIK